MYYHHYNSPGESYARYNDDGKLSGNSGFSSETQNRIIELII